MRRLLTWFRQKGLVVAVNTMDCTCLDLMAEPCAPGQCIFCANILAHDRGAYCTRCGPRCPGCGYLRGCAHGLVPDDRTLCEICTDEKMERKKGA